MQNNQSFLNEVVIKADVGRFQASFDKKIGNFQHSASYFPVKLFKMILNCWKRIFQMNLMQNTFDNDYKITLKSSN